MPVHTPPLEPTPDIEPSGVHAAVTAPPSETLGTWLQRSKPKTPQGWVAAAVVGLLALNVLMDMGRKVGISDELYPFYSQEQGTKLADEVRGLGVEVCNLIESAGQGRSETCKQYTEE